MAVSPDTLVEMKRRWMERAEADFERTVPKIVQYGGETGSADIQLMAEGLRILNPALRTAPPAVAEEAAVCFYQLGKVARTLAALSHGQLPDIDSWFDQTIYSIMARSMREEGGWV